MASPLARVSHACPFYSSRDPGAGHCVWNLLPGLYRPLFPGLHLCRTPGPNRVPQPLLSDQPAQRAADFPSRSPGLVHRCVAQTATPAGGCAGLVSEPVALSSCGGLCLCRPGQVQCRLAAPRRAAADLAASTKRPATGRSLARAGLGSLWRQLVWSALRHLHSFLPALETDPLAGVRPPGFVSRGNVGPVQHRHVSLDYDRRRAAALSGGLAATMAGVAAGTRSGFSNSSFAATWWGPRRDFLRVMVRPALLVPFGSVGGVRGGPSGVAAQALAGIAAFRLDLRRL